MAYECLGYYNAIEHLIVRMLKFKGIKIPSGGSSHKETLKAFEQMLNRRKHTFSIEIIPVIEELMAFRHVATKIYGFLLDRKKLDVIVQQIKSNHKGITDFFNMTTSFLTTL